MNANAHCNRHCGFTLVELLVVIAIITVLASLLLPALARAKGKAQGTVCIGRLKQLALATQLYVGDHGFYPGRFSREGLWTRALVPYTDEHGFTPLNVGYDANALTNTVSVFRCPRRRDGTATLGINASRFGIHVRSDLSKSTPMPVGPVAEAGVLAPSTMIAFGDAAAGNGPGKAVLLVSGAIIRGDLFFLPNDPDREWFQIVRKLHEGRLNIAFADGHSESLRIESLFFDSTDDALRRWNRDNEPHRE